MSQDAVTLLTDLVIETRKEVARLRQRVNMMIVTGPVGKAEGGRVTVDLGKDEDGEDMTSPALRLAASTGKRGGGVSAYDRPGVGELVAIISPNGEIGESSAVIPWASTGDDPAPGAAETDGLVREIGNGKVELRDDFARLTVGGVTYTLTAAGLDVSGGYIKHNGKAIDDTHEHTGVVIGGDLTGPPA